MSGFTEKQLELSNKSYINKDFESVYLELLEVAEKISRRFSPVNANEADPFIILLKLVASITDKINYNVDKNILERFMLSCTQETSMRELTEMLGYNMRYYRSAETGVVFKYIFPADSEITEISIPAFSILNTVDNIQYITTENAKIFKDQGESDKINVIQGILKELTVLDSNVIQLQNLDNNHRIYLPEVMIAENGISINNTLSSNAWKTWSASSNLNSEVYGSTVYKFGFDSARNLPFIEFPEWISDIIGDGLSIKYLITAGESGNIAPRSFTTVTRAPLPVSDNIKDADIIVYNSASAKSGQDPETLNEAYLGFKKRIGTFDTLVTCRDYANAIYNLMDIYGDAYVSNVQVGDRRTDLNYSCELVTANSSGSQTKSSVTTDPEGHPLISPYELCIYALNPITNFSHTAVDDTNGYNNSYNTITDDDSYYNLMDSLLLDYKTMIHQYKKLHPSDIAYIQNLFRLDATINTTHKVNILEQTDILINVNNALIKNYNPRNLSFGSEIAFDELIEVMERSDSRIKSISLQEPEQVSKIIYVDNSESYLFDEDNNAVDAFKFIVAKNILSGRIEAFKYDRTFNYDYEQTNARKYLDICMAITECNLPEISAAESSESPETKEIILNANEAVQFLAPALHTEVTYPYGINYYLKLINKNYIDSGTEYQLSENEELIIEYEDNNSNNRIVVYNATSNVIIKPNFKIYTSQYMYDELHKKPTKFGLSYSSDYSSDIYKFYTFSTNEQVEIRKFIYEELKTMRLCYWLTNQSQNEIKWDLYNNSDDDFVKYNYILNDGEYFFYSDKNLTSLHAFGSGTRLILSIKRSSVVDPLNPPSWKHNTYVNIDDINESGLSSLGNAFMPMPFDQSSQYLDIYENEIITLTEGDKLIISNTSTTEPVVIPNNDFIIIPDNAYIEYIYEDDDSDTVNTLPDRTSFSDSNAQWSFRSLLDIQSGPDLPQYVLGNQKITFVPGWYNEKDANYTPYTDINENYVNANIIIQSGQRFELSQPFLKSGGNNIYLEYMDLDLIRKCPSILVFDNPTSTTPIQSIDEVYYTINMNDVVPETPEIVDSTCNIDITLQTSPSNFIDIINLEDSQDPESSNISDRAYFFNNKIFYSAREAWQPYPYRRYELQQNGIFEWVPVDNIYPNHRIFAIYLTNTDDTNNIQFKAISGSAAPCLRKLNADSSVELPEFSESIDLSLGLNIIEISDVIEGSSVNLCENVILRFTINNVQDKSDLITSVKSIGLWLNELKEIIEINPMLGLSDTDNIIEYMRTKFSQQFPYFFINSTLDQAKQIEVSDSYKLNSAQAFYDVNNVANKWTLCKIDFPNSNIKIARGSKK